MATTGTCKAATTTTTTTKTKQPITNIINIGPNFINVRASLKAVMSLIEIGTHMSIIKLETVDKYILIDTCPLNDNDKSILDTITNNGTKIDSIIGTHPFHTLYFNQYYEWYPNVKYYGTPRHLRKLTSIPWTGDITDPTNLCMYESDGIYMKIPDGTDIDPNNDDNHFACVFVYHTLSQTLHVDDTLMCYNKPGCLLRCAGCRDGQVAFWLGGIQAGLQKTNNASLKFQSFMELILNEWTITNLVTAHTGNKIGNAHESIQQIVTDSIPLLTKLSQKQYKS